MPRQYVRKTLRATWKDEDLEEAMSAVRSKKMGVNEASRNFGIPSRTLRRHLLTGKLKVPLGRTPVFCNEHEKKLVAHIKKLEKVGFAPDRKDVKEMAFQLAKKLKIKNPFSEKSELAGNTWFNGFMSRNRELSQRKSEGLSLARAYGVNRKDVQDFFDLLEKIYNENDFANHPEDVYNMDESGIQVNNKPGKVVATKGAKDVYTLTSCEKGENVTVIACCNAQGNFLPPVLIYKGTYSKPQFSEGLPPGSQVFMNKKSSYINSDLFMKWFEEVFLRHKSSRKTLLILDGHSSHSNNLRLLEVAAENNVILLCLPSHTTHALQPLDRAFFSPLKVYFNQEAKAWMVRNKDKKLTRYDVSKLIGKAWGKSATVSNGVSALKSCGIFPFDPSVIPDHYFSLSDSLQEQHLTEIATQNKDKETPTASSSLLEHANKEILETDSGPSPQVRPLIEPMPGPSGLQNSAKKDIVQEQNLVEIEIEDEDNWTPIASPSLLEHATKDILDKDLETYQHARTLIEPMPGSSGLEVDVGSAQINMEEAIQRTPCKKVVLDKSDSHTHEPKPGTSSVRACCVEEDLEPSQACTDPILGPSGLKSGAELNGEPAQINIKELIQNNPRKNIAELDLGLLKLIDCKAGSKPSSDKSHNQTNKPKSGISGIHSSEIKVRSVQITPQKNDLSSHNTESQETPTKVLTDIYPIPKLPLNISKRKQKAVILNSPENIQKKKNTKKSEKISQKIPLKNRRKKRQDKSLISESSDEITKDEISDLENKPRKRKVAVRKGGKNNKKDEGGKNIKGGRERLKSKKKRKNISLSTSGNSSYEHEHEPSIDLSEEEISDEGVNKCAECTEDYYQTQSTEDWIQCTSCSGWLHEFCTMYNPLCNRCGRKAKRATIIHTLK